MEGLIDRSGDVRIQRGYDYTRTRWRGAARVTAGGPCGAARREEMLDGVRLRFESVADAGTDSQLTIGLPDGRALTLRTAST